MSLDLLWSSCLVPEQGWPHPAPLGMEKAPISLSLNFSTPTKPHELFHWQLGHVIGPNQEAGKTWVKEIAARYIVIVLGEPIFSVVLIL